MVRLTTLTRKILARHIDPNNGFPEVIILGYCSNDTAGEHISRYILASKLASGLVLDCASGSCYGSSILRRSNAVDSVISVDINRDVLQYGKMVYNTNCVHANATRLPFREISFNSVVSIETLEHIEDLKAFLSNIKFVLKKGGGLILSTPNKLYTSPFTPKPLNPYHMNEYYLGPLLKFLNSWGFKASNIYGGRKVSSLELIRRIFGSLLKFLLGELSLKPYLIDDIYHSALLNSIILKKKPQQHLMDPDLSLFTHEELKATSNVVLYQYFMIHAHKS